MRDLPWNEICKKIAFLGLSQTTKNQNTEGKKNTKKQKNNKNIFLRVGKTTPYFW